MSKILTLKIPKNWTILKLEDIGKWGSGGTPKKGIAEYYGNDIPWLKIGDLNDGLVKEAEERITKLGLRASSAKLLPPGVLLIAMYGSIGKLGITGIHCATNQAIAFCYPDVDLINLKYLFWLLRSSKSELTAAGKGGTQQNISQTVLKAFEIPLPPLNEQRRIVAKIEALKARSQKVKEALESIPPLLDQFRQSVLAAAFHGDLTADWREQNPDVEPASVLLERLSSDCLKKKDSGVASDDLIALPKNWIWTTLGQCFSLERGRFSIRPRNDPSCYDGFYPFIQIGDLPRDGGVIQKYSQTLNEKGLSVSKMFPRGTVLIAIVGATIGNTGILSFDSCCPDSLVAIRARELELSRFTEYYMCFRKVEIRRVSYASGGQPNINLQTLNPYPFPLPPSKEIIEINKRLELLNRFADKIAQQINEVGSQADLLDQSILAKAFRGELVPQDPSDEPASVLLERIKAERAKREAKAKAVKKSTGKTTGQRSRKVK